MCIRDSFIAEKTSNARYKFDMILDGLQVGVWFDNESGYYFITNKYLSLIHIY